MKILLKNLFLTFLVFLTIVSIFALVSTPLKEKKELALNQLVERINNEEVESITVKGDDLTILLKDGIEEKSRLEAKSSLTESLKNYGVEPEKLKKFALENKSETGAMFWIGTLLPIIFPFLFLIFFFWLIFGQAQKGTMQAFTFSKARARLFGAEGHPKEKITFQDVAGLKEAKEELQEIVEFLKHPKKFLDMGARIPRGVLLMGPPGTGKTLLARAVAGEANVPFFHISGSEFVEMFVGVGAARVRDLFATAKKGAPSIVFIDELDAVGRQRGAGLGGGHDEREQTLNQILVEMDGFERDTHVIVMSATNRPDVLDPALLRPGRFDRRVVLDEPDLKDREEILKIHVKDKPLAPGVNLREIAERTPGFSGADLANIVNEAAIFAARRNKKEIWQEELRESIEKVMLGPERKSHILSQREKEIAAYHEGGHALIASVLPGADPVQKVSIVSRGHVAGYTLKLPLEDRHLRSRSEFLAELAVLMGGYAAEKLIFKELTTGASSDLEKASDLARRLVKEYGMSEKLGPIVFGEKEELVFLGREIGEQRNYSEEVAAKIDKEISKLLRQALKTANKIILGKRALLEKIAKRLIEKETIEREEFQQLIKS